MNKKRILALALAASMSLGLAACGGGGGSTKELMKNLRIIRDRQARIILITRFPKSPGAAYADIVLQCGSREGPLQGGSVAARIAQLYLMDVLFHEVCRRDREGCRARQELVAEVLSDKHI